MKFTPSTAICTSLALLALSFLTPPASAAPEIVYRVDARSPDEIFKHGFRAWGTNDDVLAHVSGKSTNIGSRDSAFIATTEDMGEALRFLNFFLSRNTKNHYWLYRIYTAENFWSTNQTLLHLTQNPQHYSENSVRAAEILYATFSAQKEWLAKLVIPAGTIIDAAGYQWNDHTNSIKPTAFRTHESIKPTARASDEAYIFTPNNVHEYTYIKAGKCNVISEDFCPANDELGRDLKSPHECQGLPIESSSHKPLACPALSVLGLFPLN
jgi:pertussis toxin subunit 1